MQARLTDISRNEALLYLGYHGGSIPEDVAENLAQCKSLLLETAQPRAVWRQFNLLPDGRLDQTDFRPEGNDVHELLKDCRQIILLGATLGAETEALLRRAQARDMARAVILDACASAAIENVCDNLCADLQTSVAPLYLTDRFSPGYGDMPFSQLPEICRVLDMSRRIGVNLTPGGLMVPQKSVTALMGLSPIPQPKRSRGCAACNMFETCQYRKDGISCESS